MKTKLTDKASLKRLSFKRSIELQKSFGGYTSQTSPFLIENVNFNKDWKKIQDIWDKENVYCTGPNIYDSVKVITNNHKKIFKKGEVNSFKLCLFDIKNSDKIFMCDMNEKFKKDINQSLECWGQYETHYLLDTNTENNNSHITLSKRDTPISIHSWLHIHDCKKCIEYLCIELGSYTNYQFKLYDNERTDYLSSCDSGLFDKNILPLFYESTFCYNASDNIYNRKKRFVKRNSRWGKFDKYRLKMKFSKKYYRKIEYCNSYGFHSKFPESFENSTNWEENNEEQPEFNPYLRVVCETDPCALNFPMQLEEPDETETNSQNSGAPVTEQSSENIFPNNYRIGDDGSLKYPDFLTDLSTHSTVTLMPAINKSNLSSHETSLTLSYSDYFLQGEPVKGKPVAISRRPSLTTISKDFCLDHGIPEGSSCLITTEKIDAKRSKSNFIIKSISDSDIHHLKFVPALSNSRISIQMSTTSLNSSDPEVDFTDSNNFKQMYNEGYPYDGKDLFVCIIKPYTLKQNSSAYYHNDKQVKKKKRIPLHLGVPLSSPMSDKFSLDIIKNNILPLKSPTSVNLTDSSFKVISYNILTFLLQVCLELLLIIFFCTAVYLLTNSENFWFNKSGSHSKGEHTLFQWYG